MTEEDEGQLETVVTTAPKAKFTDQEEYVDNFSLTYSSVRKLHGLNKAFVKRTDRKIRGTYSKQIETDDVLGYAYLDCVVPPNNMDYLAKLYDISPAHRAAVDAKVSSVVGLGYKWVETAKFRNTKANAKTDAARRKIEKQLDDAMANIEEWIEDINTVDSFDEVLRKLWVDYETTGNAYMEISRDVQGKVRYIGQIPARWMRVRRERDGFVQVFSNQIRYFRNLGDANPNPITDDQYPNEIIHFKKYSPMNAYYGSPNILSAKNALAGNEFASRYNLDYFENKAIPRFVIIAKGSGLSQRAINRLVEFFESGLRGQHHRSIFVPLSKDSDASIEFQEIEKGQAQDSSFSTYREANNEEIFMAHGIPPTRAGVFSSNISLAAAATANKVFKESYSRPEQAIFEKKFNRVIKSMTDILKFQLDELSLTDADTQSKIDEREVRMGIKVPDEVRAVQGKSPRPDGEGQQPWQANAQQAAEQNAQSTRNRKRDSDRSAAASDSQDNPRQPQGSGRATA